ncbi:MAG: hypothetical protein CM15mP119_0650 [Alphaproteobacteria bacterium]|nr:MAG: hypothetical protein CM15mP119_0650 [Alphaproteobacteria bacterium]
MRRCKFNPPAHLCPRGRQRYPLKVREQGVSARYKADASPVTLADEQANAILVAALADLYPDLPVISEEESGSHKLSPRRCMLWLTRSGGTREFLRSDSAGPGL